MLSFLESRDLHMSSRQIRFVSRVERKTGEIYTRRCRCYMSKLQEIRDEMNLKGAKMF